jgi:hypothetical protein
MQRAEEVSEYRSSNLFSHVGFQNTKTGSWSVRDPVLGVTESPMGDATMLPVLALKHLGRIDPRAVIWVGMSPTNIGFQFLQEAYQKGKWFGDKPLFQLPKAYRPYFKRLLTTEAAEGSSSEGNPTVRLPNLTRMMHGPANRLPKRVSRSLVDLNPTRSNGQRQ